LVCVEDSGPGVSAELAARLFEPFVTDKMSGMGLGLALSRSLLRHQGGDLWFEPGRLAGARFVVRLPTRQLRSRPYEQRDGTVFLIDDDASVRDSLTLLLSLKGLRTQSFANAESFITTYQADTVGCVLTDLRMPGMSGLELQADLRARELQVPVVVLTAHGDVATARAALKNGAFDFLQKPVDDAMRSSSQQRLRADRARRASTPASGMSGSASHDTRARDPQLIAAGHANREIAAQLRISAHRRFTRRTSWRSCAAARSPT
jgi:FixJ family two-component response regulator